jgi:NitT/TauT family transport system permease protein
VKTTINQLIFGAGVLVVWEAVTLMKLWPPYAFPTPQGVAESLWFGFADHSFWIGIGVSMRRVAVGYSISVVLGILLGMAIASNGFLEDTVGRLVLSLQSLPSICWLPMSVLWFGLTEKAIIFVAVIGSLLAVTLNTKAGFDNVPRILSMAGRNLGARVPASLPSLVDGLRQGWAFAWRSLISGEMIFVTVGLGQLLMMGRDLNDINQVFAVMVLIAGLGYLMDGILFRRIETSVRYKWGITAAAAK